MRHCAYGPFGRNILFNASLSRKISDRQMPAVPDGHKPKAKTQSDDRIGLADEMKRLSCRVDGQFDLDVEVAGNLEAI